MTRTNINNIKDKNVLIVGLGKSGTASCQAFLDLGAKVFIQDKRSERDFDGGFINYLRSRGVELIFHSVPDDLSIFDMIVLSPGASPELDFVIKAKEMGVEVTGELEIAYRISKGNFVAITGTNGKTTTTTLTGKIFKDAGRKVYVVGNIGTAAIQDALKAEEQEWLITEASSFQLETTKYFKPAVSAILNLSPDHLDRHHTMDEYIAAKAKVFMNQREDGYLILNYDDKSCLKLAKKAKAKVVFFSRKKEVELGAYIKDENIVVRDESGIDHVIAMVNDLKIIGDHNVENALAASAISFFSGIKPEVIGKAISEFGGVEHRLEFCGEIDGVSFYNDSKGTNIDASITAIKALKENIILIAGGDGKGQDFSEFVKEFKGRIKYMLLIGKDKKKIADAADKVGFKDYKFCKDIPECVNEVITISEPGDSVLLSPACASWDMYDNYEQRGDHFKECVWRGMSK